MPVNCPSCNLLFRSSNELDWHVREEHTRPRLAARTPPAEDAATPASRHGPAVTTDAARAGRDGPPTSHGPSEPGAARMAAGPLAWLRNRLGRSRRPRPPQ